MCLLLTLKFKQNVGHSHRISPEKSQNLTFLSFAVRTGKNPSFKQHLWSLVLIINLKESRITWEMSLVEYFGEAVLTTLTEAETSSHSGWQRKGAKQSPHCFLFLTENMMLPMVSNFGYLYSQCVRPYA